MRFLMIKDDVGAIHFIKVTNEEWEQSHIAGGWMVELFGTNSSYYQYTSNEVDDGIYIDPAFITLEEFKLKIL